MQVRSASERTLRDGLPQPDAVWWPNDTSALDKTLGIGRPGLQPHQGIQYAYRGVMFRVVCWSEVDGWCVATVLPLGRP